MSTYTQPAYERIARDIAVWARNQPPLRLARWVAIGAWGALIAVWLTWYVARVIALLV